MNSGSPDPTPAWLASRLASGPPLLAPGAYDALSAKLVEAAGYEAIYVGGYSIAGGAYALPDIGLVGAAELLDAYRRIRAATSLPLIVDADHGYGGPATVARTVGALKDVGVAALHVEDQTSPKRCGHMADKQVVSVAEATARVRAAVAAAGSDGPLIIARTDALQPEGLTSALERGRAFEDAGASAFFVDAPSSVTELAAIREAVDIPVVFNAASSGKTPLLSLDQVSELGYELVIWPNQLLYVASRAVRDWLATAPGMAATNAETGLPAFAEFNDFLGLSRYTEWDHEIAAGAPRSTVN